MTDKGKKVSGIWEKNLSKVGGKLHKKLIVPVFLRKAILKLFGTEKHNFNQAKVEVNFITGVVVTPRGKALGY